MAIRDSLGQHNQYLGYCPSARHLYPVRYGCLFTHCNVGVPDCNETHIIGSVGSVNIFTKKRMMVHPEISGNFIVSVD